MTPSTPDNAEQAVNVALLPCPFCSSDNLRLHRDAKAEMSWVACISCGLEAPTETGTSESDAVAYWNRRAAPTLPADVKGLVDEWRKAMEGVTPGPWFTGRLGIEPMPHVVDFGPPPKSPYMIVRQGRPSKPGYAGQSPSGVCHADDGSSPANARYIAHCSPENIEVLLSAITAQAALLDRAQEDAHVISVIERELGDWVCDGPDEQETTVSGLIKAEREQFRAASRLHHEMAEG